MLSIMILSGINNIIKYIINTYKTIFLLIKSSNNNQNDLLFLQIGPILAILENIKTFNIQHNLSIQGSRPRPCDYVIYVR